MGGVLGGELLFDGERFGLLPCVGFECWVLAAVGVECIVRCFYIFINLPFEYLNFTFQVLLGQHLASLSP